MRDRPRKAVQAIVLAALLVAALPAAARADFTPGAKGLGDPFFPDAGNGGYDVASYDLSIDYTPDTNHLVGAATITATATQDLSAFDLDFRHLRIDTLTVDGADANFARSGQELTVTPPAGIPNGSQFTVAVGYSGKPENAIDPDGSKDGWVPTDDGAFVASEPQGAPTWFPCNDYPTDKATFHIAITVPKDVKAISNGALVARQQDGTRVTWIYDEPQPMATYLATATVGRFKVEQGTAAGIRSLVAVDPRLAKDSDNTLRKQGEMLRLWGRLFGDYPFSDTGAIVDFAPQVGYALETQTRPLFDNAADGATLAHELAHQWFGDSVSVASWPEMWLNEGFATWAEWRWAQHRGRVTLAERFARLKRQPESDPLWSFPPAAIPAASQLFSTPVYARGAMALEALRERVGTPTFLLILRTWAAEHRYGNVTTQEFIAHAETVSGKPVGDLLHRWLFEPGKP
jgi:aminopeptidase N